MEERYKTTTMITVNKETKNVLKAQASRAGMTMMEFLDFLVAEYEMSS